MDSGFGFLSVGAAELLGDVLTRRDPALLARVQLAGSVSRSDAEQIMNVLSEELTSNLDDDWEPTEYGRAVSTVLARLNAARVAEWP